MIARQIGFGLLAVLLGGLLLPSPGGAASDLPEVMFILDASGSMWGTAGSQTKIEAAKDVMARAVPALPEGVKAGLAAYGHRRKGDCEDIEILIPSGSDNRQGLIGKVKTLTPKGKTPLAASVMMVADTLKQNENETTIVLVSDGIETCHDDPCGAVKALREAGIKFVLHVVGFGVGDEATEQLQCMAKAGEGQYFPAGDARSLLAAMDTVKEDVVVKVEKAKTTKVATKSRLGKLEITMPQSAVISLAEIRIIRSADGKLLKKAEPAASASHPLMAGKYQVVLAFANTNYQPASEAPIGEVEVVGGETTQIDLGAVVINMAEGLNEGIVAVGLTDQATGKDFVTIHAKGNDYYLYRPKPVPAGTYTLVFILGRSDFPAPVAQKIEVSEGMETVVTIDSGIALGEAPGVTGWDLHPAGSDETILEVRRRWDNDWPLWKNFPVPPGAYDLYVLQDGMSEPLPVGEGIQVHRGQTVVFDSGM